MYSKDCHLTSQFVDELLHYECDTGIFTWKPRPIKSGCIAHLVGKRAGRIASNGYRDICIKGRRYREHRLAWLLVTGKIPDGEIDHIDGNKINNIWINLRLSSRVQNMHNRGIRATNTSGYKGVTWARSKQKWCAQIDAYGKHYFLGYFDCRINAYIAYCMAAERLHGEFARVA